MKKVKCSLIITIFLILLLTGGIGLYYYKTHYITASLTKEPQTEITGTLNRSDCGWYQLYSYYLRQGSGLQPNELYKKERDEDGYPFRLALLEFNLAEYAETELDEAALANIRQVLEQFSATKAKVIVRFLYDWDGLGMEKEPESIEIIEKHMEQTGAVLNEFEKLIYTTQGIFVGSWAEMHDSKYLSAKDMTRLILRYAQSTSSSIYLAVRTPNQYRTIFQEMEKHPERYKAFAITPEELKARLGLYNDGMLGSMSDVGTYQAGEFTASSVSEQELRKQELNFQNTLCLRVPNGGEAVNDNPCNDWKNAVSDLSTMHVSYLNQMHDEAVIRKWKQSIYKKKDSIYNGSSVYDYITDHMGARFVLRDCSLSYQPFQKGYAKGTVTIENTGFSNLYHKKHFTLSLISQETGETVLLLDSDREADKIDSRQWNSGECTVLSFSFSPFALEDGKYTLTAVLKEPDSDTLFSFANDSYHDILNGYPLGIITIKR